MKVRMKVSMSGTLDGVPYPQAGEVGDLPEVVAQKLLLSGQAVKAGAHLDEVEAAAREEQREVEARPALTGDVETTAVETTPAKRPVGRPRKAAK